jgi:hypothetical protein
MAAKSKKKKNKQVSKPKTIKIGITLGLKDNKESIWTNDSVFALTFVAQFLLAS